jgi:hypothetical protein
MQLKNRLATLEKQLNVGNVSDEFCACNGSQPIYKQTFADDGILRRPEDADAEICELCGRAVNKTVIIVDFTSKAGNPD